MSRWPKLEELLDVLAQSSQSTMEGRCLNAHGLALQKVDLQNQEYKRMIYSTNAGTKSQSGNVAGLHGTTQNKMSDSKIKRWNAQHMSKSKRVISGSGE